jgi:PPK2 family polyphosphate:nucleotide phosphotransferase
MASAASPRLQHPSMPGGTTIKMSRAKTFVMAMKLNEFGNHFCVEPGKKAKMTDYDPDFTAGFKEEESKEMLEFNRMRLEELQTLLYAEHKYSLLIVLQGMDTAGKDGTISHVMSGVNPQSCSAIPFKVPTQEELDHDFLWRVHKVTPKLGEIVLFNRSYYEDVLTVRVHGLVPEAVWSSRYPLINDFERLLTGNGTKILKFYLHISKDEQKKRLQERLDDPAKNWKMSLNDIKEREYWDTYMNAYEDAINLCSTSYAPWHVIPSNKKWFRNLAISQIIIETLEGLNLKLPKPPFDPKSVKID